MRLNLIRFKVALKKRHQNKGSETIGSAIKFKRKELKMTLEEASEGICSISYLSKLENNVIEPSDRYVFKLKKRFCINESTNGMDDVTCNMLVHKLMVQMLNDGKLNITFLDGINHQINYQTTLLKLGFYVLNDMSKEMYRTYQHMVSMIGSMDDHLFNILVCLVSQILYEEARYQEANDLLAMLPKKEMHEILKLYCDKHMLINAIHLDNVALFHELYPRYQEALVRMGYYKQMHELTCYKLTYFVNVMGISSYQNLLNKYHHLSKKFKQKAEFMNLYANGKYQVIIDQIKKPPEELCNSLFITKLLALDALGETKEIVKYLKVAQSKCLTYNQRLIVNFLKAKHTYEKKALMIYLRTVILGDGALTDDVKILMFLQHQAHRLFSKYFFYKEATLVYSKFNLRMKQLRQSDYLVMEESMGSFFMIKR